MGREKRLALLLEVGLISIEKTIQPRQELLGAVIGVQDDWDTVCWGNGADVVGTSNATGDGGLLLAIGNALLEYQSEWFMRDLILGYFYLSGEVCGTALGHLEDDRGLLVAGSLEGGDDGGGGGDVLSVSACLSPDNGNSSEYSRWRGWQSCAPERS